MAERIRRTSSQAGGVLMASLVTAAAWAGPVAMDLGAGHYQVTFHFKPFPGVRTVHLAGTFNGWVPHALPMTGPDKDGVFSVTLHLDRGRYEYKFVLNGAQWVTDPDNPLKVQPHDNAVLFVGPHEEVVAPDAVQATREVNMALRAANPPEMVALVERVERMSPDSRHAAVWRWLREHRMPLIHRDTVSFVFMPTRALLAEHPGLAGEIQSGAASSVSVAIEGRGFWTVYELPRLTAAVPLYGLSLQRSDIPDQAVYRLTIESGERTTVVADPGAWTVTSRQGRPVGVITEPDSKRGRIELIRDLRPAFGSLRPREVYVYLPPGFNREARQHLPVLYMHDGQNCWDDPTEPFGHGGWQVNLVADRLINAGMVKPFIVVGIPNTPDRLAEYGPGRDIFSGDDHAYLQFLIRDIKPLIDKRYATRPGPDGAALMGSSMGGIISLQGVLQFPTVFGAAACLSPSLEIPPAKDGQGRDHFDLLSRTGKVPVRIYIDSGTAGPGQDGAPGTRRMGQALIEAGWVEGEDLMRFEAHGAEHNESAWRSRLAKPIEFLFGEHPSH